MDRKGVEYNVPDKIETKPYDPNIFQGPDNFDSILLDDISGTVGTVGTVSDGKDGASGTVGTVGTVSDGKDGGTNGKDDGQIREEEHGIEGPIKTENSPTHPIEPFQVFQTFQKSEEDQNQGKHITSDMSSNESIAPEQTTNTYPESVPTVPTVPTGGNGDSEDLPEPSQNTPKMLETFDPIISVEDFFGSNDISLLDHHSIEESPCYHIIGSRTDEMPGNVVDDDGNVVDKMGYPNTVYYCKLHPDLGSVFLEEIEFHCRQKEPEHHKTAILARHDTISGESA